MSTTSAEADGVCLENGKPISELKVVELRKELESRNLPKSGNKKELHERLRNYLMSTGEGNNIVGSPGRQSGSAHSSPVKSPEPVENPMIAKYRASQEQALRAARQEAELSKALSTDEAEAADNAEEKTLQRTESDPDSPTKKDETVEQEVDTTEPTEQVVETPKSTVADATVAERNACEDKVDERDATPERQEKAHSDSGGESTKSFIEEPEVVGKKAEEKVKAQEEVKKPEPIQPEEEEVNPADNESSSSDNEEEADTKEKASSSSSPGSAASPTTNKEAEKVEENSAPKASEIAPTVDASEPAANVESVVLLDTQVELDYEEEEDEGQSKPNSLTTTSSKPSVVPVQASTEGVVKVADVPSDSGGDKPKTSSPKEQVTENLTPEGLVRRRPASPARNPLSQLIHVRGLKRPFTVKALQNLLGNFGKLVEDGFWIDSIKSNCIVKFETEEQAQLARERLHNVIWPASSDLSLIVEFSSEDKLTRRRNEGKVEQKDPIATPIAGLGLTVTVENEASKWKDVDAPPRKSSREVGKDNLAEKAETKEKARSPSRKRKAVVESKEPQKTLEDIFKKTNAQPHIYYLPLTDEEADKRAEKKQKERETAIKSGRNGGERERDRNFDRNNRRRSSPAAHQSAASRQRSPERKRDRRDSPVADIERSSKFNGWCDPCQ
uniref:SAP domain-containing protein n=1 Tax=Ditylenchus dipsaci TaxID=166011 RepID=A0A915EGE2_9BILA